MNVQQMNENAVQDAAAEKKSSRDRRRVLTAGTVIRSKDGCEITVIDTLGKGSSCITYNVNVKFPDSEPSYMLMKELYPRHDQISYEEQRTHGCHLMVKESAQSAAFDHLLERFLAAYRIQRELANKPETKPFVVEPLMALTGERITEDEEVSIPRGYDDRTLFVIYENDFSSSLCNLQKNMDASELLHMGIQLMTALHQIHEAGKVLYMDIEPENILWTNGMVKLFDFDAVLPLDQEKRVLFHEIGIRGNDRRIQAEEIEQIRAASSQETEALRVLNPSVDVHNAGAMLFRLFAGKEFTKEQVEEGLDAFEKVLDNSEKAVKRLKTDERRMLAEILYKAVRNKPARVNRTRTCFRDRRETVQDPYPRYTNAQQMAEELGVLARMADTHSFIGEEYGKLEWFRETAALLDTCSPFDYVPEGNDEVHIGIIGEHEIAKTIFRNVLGALTMPETKLHIHWAMKNPKAFLNNWMQAEPNMSLVMQMTRVELNGNSWQPSSVITKDEKMKYTSEDFAVIHLDTLEQGALPWFKEGVNENTEPLWIAVADEDPAKNEYYVQVLKNTLKDHKALIAYGGAGKAKSSRKVKCVPFACEETKVLNRTKEDIERKALAIHTMYCLSYDDKSARIKESFDSDPYNVRSSIACALSIRSKLRSLGIKYDKKAAQNYYKLVVKDPSNGNMNKMVYMEHLRWSAFMMLEGYSCPDDATLKGYIYTGNYDHRKRDQAPLYQPLIRAMKIDPECSSGTPLDSLQHSQWCNVSLKDYDELDKMSLKLHRYCNEKVKKLDQNRTLQNLVHDLETEITRSINAQGYWSREPEATVKLKEFGNEVENALKQVTGGSESLYEELSYFERKNKETGITEAECKEKCTDILNRIKRHLKVVTARNAYHDYKKNDDAIIRNLPLILDEGSIRVIRKPATGVLFHDIFSTMVLRPETLILAHASEDETDHAAQFLRERNILTEVKNEKEFGLTEPEDGTYLDLSGIDVISSLTILQDHVWKKVPRLAFDPKSDRLVSLFKADNISYRTMMPRLTVSETICLSGGKHLHPVSGNAPDKMPGDTYRDLMKIAMEMAGNWDGFATALNAVINHAVKIELKQKSDQTKVEAVSSDRVSRDRIRQTNLEAVLEDMKAKGMLESYTLPSVAGTISLVSVKYSQGELQRMADWFAGQLNDVYGFAHRFVSRDNYKTICDETLCVHYTENRHADDRVIQNKELMKEGLKKLFAVKDDAGEQKLLVNLESDGSPMHFSNLSQGVWFAAGSSAVLSCLEKGGNILEAYTYHSIRKHVNVDDIRMNVVISWDRNAVNEAQDISNELDVILTKNSRSCFISCKMQKPTTAHLMEIRYLTDKFGVNGIPVLVTSRVVEHNAVDSIGRRAEEMGVVLIDKSELDHLGERIAEILK